MSTTSDLLIRDVAELLDDHLHTQEANRSALSRLAAGAAFEAWLSFETRLLMEQHRGALGLDEQIVDRHGERVHRFFITNEYRKVDLGILDVREHEGRWDLAIEFKIVHNNKNWRQKCDEVWADLLPVAGTVKSEIQPARGRYAIVAVVGKVYRDPGPYGWRSDLAAWEREAWDYMLPNSGEYAGRVTRVCSSQRFPISDPSFRQSEPSFCELHVLGAPAR
jgi:hypothetical protein